MLALLVVWRAEVEVDSTQWPIGVALAQNYSDLPVQRNPVAQTWLAILERIDGSCQQRSQGATTLVCCLVDANDVPVENAQRFLDLRLECVKCH